MLDKTFEGLLALLLDNKNSTNENFKGNRKKRLEDYANEQANYRGYANWLDSCKIIQECNDNPRT